MQDISHGIPGVLQASALSEQKINDTTITQVAAL
jgi:hypothetical protein